MNSYLSTDHAPEAIDLKKYKRKPIWPLMFILLPTVFVLIYGALVGFDILPHSIVLGDYRIRFLGLFDGYMVWVSVATLLVLPIITIVCMIFRASGNSQRAMALEKAEHRLHVESLYRDSDEHHGDAADVADTSAHSSYTHDISEVSTATVAPDSSVVAFSYNKLKLIDMEQRSRGYDETAVYNDELTLAELCDDFIEYAAAYGMKIPAETARSIFSSMCASHVIWVSGKNKELARRTLETLSSYFGSPLNIDRSGESVSTYDSATVRMGRHGGAYAETPFLIDVYSANYTHKGIRFAAIENIKTEDAERALKDYLNGADVVTRERHARVAPVEYDAHNFVAFITGDQLRLYPNMWYIIIPQDSAPLPVSAIALDLSAVSQDDSARRGVAQPTTVSAARLYELSASARDAHAIPEDYWKKIDALEAYIAGKMSYRLDNKSIRRMEAYAAAAMSAGAELIAAIDAAIAAKMLPALAACPIESIQGDEDGIVAFIDRTFGIDNMPCSYECIRKLGVA